MKLKKGFTLVELLIVIVVIGILSAMMMLSSNEAVSSAKAARIINDLRNWRTAAMAWYIDNLDKVDVNGKIIKADGSKGNFADSVNIMEIAKYFSNSFTQDGSNTRFAKDGHGGRYYVDHNTIQGSNAFRWFIGYEMPTNDKKLQEKLEAKAATAAGGLYSKFYNSSLEGPYTSTSHTPRCICIEVIDFSKK